MATYYTTSSNQRDAMPTLYLRDLRNAPYPESSHPGNMPYMNYLSSTSYSDSLTGQTQSEQNCVELSIPSTFLSHDSSIEGQDFIASRFGDHTYNSWRDGENEMLLMHTIGGSMSNADDLVRAPVTHDIQMGLQTQIGVLNTQNLSLQQSRVSGMQGQGLSLSLSSQFPMPSLRYQPASSDFSVMGSHQSASKNVGPCRDDNPRDRLMYANNSPCGLSSPASTIPNSKYLKATQQLLDEVVNVGKALKNKSDKSQSFQASDKENDGGSKSDALTQNPQGAAVPSAELSPSEQQDLQTKLTKLLAMLDEVDRRYKQYYHQMQIVVSSFDVIAGYGAAKPYTALALQTISRHFCCLRDAINGQIQATRKSLGEQDASSGNSGGISRLRYIDQHIRQQRAFQQFGMQQHVWRPQRGLPESAVSVLRAWLFEHFLHPYPKDSDKLMLARQTGLTRSQVLNWFINARVRLWKPMIEEMYKEEIGDTEMDSNSSSEHASKGKDEIRLPEDMDELQSIKPSGERCPPNQLNDSSKSALIRDMGMGRESAGFLNEANPDETNYMNLKSRDQRPNAEDYNFLEDALVQSDGSGRFKSYQMQALRSYGHDGDGVSLTLGLQHCDGVLPLSAANQSFVSTRDEVYTGAPSVGVVTDDYDCIDMADRRHSLSSPHLLHDFVA